MGFSRTESRRKMKKAASVAAIAGNIPRNNQAPRRFNTSSAARSSNDEDNERSIQDRTLAATAKLQKLMLLIPDSAARHDDPPDPPDDDITVIDLQKSPDAVSSNAAALRIQARRVQQRAAAVRAAAKVFSDQNRLQQSSKSFGSGSNWLSQDESDVDFSKVAVTSPVSYFEKAEAKAVEMKEAKKASRRRTDTAKQKEKRALELGSGHGKHAEDHDAEKVRKLTTLSMDQQKYLAKAFFDNETFMESDDAHDARRYWGLNGSITLAEAPALAAACLEELEPDVQLEESELVSFFADLPVDPLVFDPQEQRKSADHKLFSLQVFIERMDVCMEVRHSRYPSSSCKTYLQQTSCKVIVKIVHLMLICLTMVSEIFLDSTLLAMLQDPLNTSQATDIDYLRSRLPIFGFATDLPLPMNGQFAGHVVREANGQFFTYSNFSCLESVVCTDWNASAPSSNGPCTPLSVGSSVLRQRETQCLAGAGSGMDAFHEHGVQFRLDSTGAVLPATAPMDSVAHSLTIPWYPGYYWLPISNQSTETGFPWNISSIEYPDHCDDPKLVSGHDGDLRIMREQAGSAIDNVELTSMWDFLDFSERFDERYYEFGGFFCRALQSETDCNEYNIYDNPIETDLSKLPRNVTADILDTQYRCGWDLISETCDVISLRESEYTYFAYQYCGFFARDSCVLDSHIVRCTVNPQVNPLPEEGGGFWNTSTAAPTDREPGSHFECLPDLASGVGVADTISTVAAIGGPATAEIFVAYCAIQDGTDLNTSVTTDSAAASVLVDTSILDAAIVDCDGFAAYLEGLESVHDAVLTSGRLLWYARLLNRNGSFALTLETAGGDDSPPSIVIHSASLDAEVRQRDKQTIPLQTCLLPSAVIESETFGLFGTWAVSCVVALLTFVTIVWFLSTALFGCAHTDNPNAVRAFQLYGHNTEREVALQRARAAQAKAKRQALKAGRKSKRSSGILPALALSLKRRALVAQGCFMLSIEALKKRTFARTIFGRMSPAKAQRLRLARNLEDSRAARRCLRIMMGLHTLCSVGRLIAYASIIGVLRCFLAPMAQPTNGSAYVSTVTAFAWDEWDVVLDPMWFVWPSKILTDLEASYTFGNISESAGQTPGIVQYLWGAFAFVVANQLRCHWGDAALMALFNTDVKWIWLRPIFAIISVVIPVGLWMYPVISILALTQLRYIGNAANSAALSWWDAPYIVHVFALVSIVAAAWLLVPLRNGLNELCRRSTHPVAKPRGVNKIRPVSKSDETASKKSVDGLETDVTERADLSAKAAVSSLEGKQSTDANHISQQGDGETPVADLNDSTKSEKVPKTNVILERLADAVRVAPTVEPSRKPVCWRLRSRLFGSCGGSNSVFMDELFVAEAVVRKLATPATQEHDEQNQETVVHMDGEEPKEPEEESTFDGDVPFVGKRFRVELVPAGVLFCGGAPILVVIASVAAVASTAFYFFGFDYHIDYGEILDYEFRSSYGTVSGSVTVALMSSDTFFCFYDGLLIYDIHLVVSVLVIFVALVSQLFCCCLK